MPKKTHTAFTGEEVEEIRLTNRPARNQEAEVAAKAELSAEEVTANEKARAEHVAKTIDSQVVEDARKQEEDAIQAGKDTELLEDQVWEERQDGNPFVRPHQATITEVRKNSTEQVYVKFVVVNPGRADLKVPFEYLAEEEFRARFIKQVK